MIVTTSRFWISNLTNSRCPNQPKKLKERKGKSGRNSRPHRQLSSQSPASPSSTRTRRPPRQTKREPDFGSWQAALNAPRVHYLLAFHPGPDGWTSGFHRIAVTTNRSEIKLSYRHEYYVGLATPANRPILEKEKVDQLLQQSACYYPVIPLSIMLQARLIDTGRKDVLRYLVSVDASSLSFLTLNSDSTAGVLQASTAELSSITEPATSTKAGIHSVISTHRLNRC